MGVLDQYRKAIAALLAGVLGLSAQFIPGVSDQVGPEVIQVVSVLLAAGAAFAFSNRVEGFNVNDLARFVINSLDGDVSVVSLDGKTIIDSGDVVKGMNS